MARRTLRALDRRIIKRTIQAGAKKGVTNISTKEMSTILGITEPTIYVHYGTKDNLLLEAFNECGKSIRACEDLALETFEKSEKSEKDVIALLDELISLNDVGAEKIAYALDYVRIGRYKISETDKVFYRKVLLSLGGKEENLDCFFYVLAALRGCEIRNLVARPKDVYKALVEYIK